MYRSLLFLLAATCSVAENVDKTGDPDPIVIPESCSGVPQARQNADFDVVLGYPLALVASAVNTRTTVVTVTARIVGAGGACDLTTPAAFLQAASIGFDDPYVVLDEGFCPSVAVGLFPGGDVYFYAMPSHSANMNDPAKLQIRFQ